MHCRESAKRTVAASPQGSLIVILKDNMKSTWQFRQFKAEATQTVRKVEQRHMRLHRHTFACPSPEHSTNVQLLGRAALHHAGLHTHNHTLIFAHTSAQGYIKSRLSAHIPTGHCSLAQQVHSYIQADVHTC